MEAVSDISVAALTESKYMKPIRMKYVQNGVAKAWDMSIGHPSVAIVIFNTTSQKLVLVKQLRPAVLLTEVMQSCPASMQQIDQVNDHLKGLSGDVGARGITLEVCAGIVDKSDHSLAEIAAEEVEEECGFKLGSPIEFVQSFRASIGTGGSMMSLFYAEVSEDLRVSTGGGVASEGELIEVVEMSVEEVRAYLGQPSVNSPTFTLYALQWFLLHKAGNFCASRP